MRFPRLSPRSARRGPRPPADALLRGGDGPFRLLFAHHPHPMWVCDVETLAFLEVNEAAIAHYGYDRDEFLAMRITDIRPPEDVPRLLNNLWSDRPALDHAGRWRHRLKDGRLIDVEITAHALTWAGRPAELVVAQDITERLRAEAALAHERDLLHALMESLPDFVYFKDLDSRFTRLNRITAAGLGCDDPAEAIGKDDFAFYPEAMAEQFLADERRILATGEPLRNRLEAQTAETDDDPAPAQRWLLTSKAPILDAAGQIVGLVGSAKDVTDQMRTEAALRREEERLRLALAAADMATWDRDLATGAVVRSARMAALYGLPPGAFDDPDLDPRSLVHPDDRHLLDPIEDWQIRTDADFDVEYRVVWPDGGTRWLKERGRALADAAGRPIRLLGVATDITERKALEEQLAHQAFHDPLTGLPNRALFTDRLAQALRRARRAPASVAVLFLDLDNFKLVNDGLGHDRGDRVLVAAAERLRGCLRPADTAARLGGDEFTLLLEDVADVSDAARVAERVIEAVRAPLTIDGREVAVTASIGIALNTPAQDRPEALLRDADAALYRAKETGKARYRVFDPEMNARALERLELENDLRRAVEGGELRVEYQPVIALDSGRIAKMEALVRWHHPRRGVLPPATFISLAEETGLILAIGRWVLDEACRQGALWQEQRPGEPPIVGVNFSGRQFQHPDLVENVARALVRHELDPACLELEIAERVVMEDGDDAIATLTRLKDLGVRLALDDVGTGPSSLSALTRLPLDTLKIDKTLVAGLGVNPGDTAIVQAVAELGRVLGLHLTGEGVETAEQLAHLRALQFSTGQGFYFAHPLPTTAATACLAQRPLAASDAGNEADEPILALVEA